MTAAVTVHVPDDLSVAATEGVAVAHPLGELKVADAAGGLSATTQDGVMVHPPLDLSVTAGDGVTALTRRDWRLPAALSSSGHGSFGPTSLTQGSIDMLEVGSDFILYSLSFYNMFMCIVTNIGILKSIYRIKRVT